jgi:hypothetical protein
MDIGNGKKRRKQSRPVRIPASEDDPSGPPPEEGEVVKGRPSSSHPLNLSSTCVSHEENNCSSGDCSGEEGDEGKTDEIGGQGTNNDDDPKNLLPSSFSPGLFPRHPFTSLFPGSVNLFPGQNSGGVGNNNSSGSGNVNHRGTPASSASSVGSNNSGVGQGIQLGSVPVSGVVGSGGGGSSTLGNLPPHRIFNPEAYCDLCNKEFCNKYFLKTHKANKHGVYSELSPSLLGSGSPSNTSFLSGTPILSSSGGPSSATAALLQHHHQQMQLQQQQQQQQQQQNSSGGGGSVPPPVSAGSSLLGAANKGPSATSSSSEIPFSLGPFSTEKGTAGSSTSNGGRESFCELCQKEFCNKYFLKRHKAKIHGIPVEHGYSGGSGRSNSSSSSNHGTKRFSNGLGVGSSSNAAAESFNNNNNNNNHGGGGSKGQTGGTLSQSLRDMGLETLGLELVTKHLANEAKEEGELSGDEFSESRKRAAATAADEEDEEDEEGQCPPHSSDPTHQTSFKMSGENACQFCFREFSSRSLLCAHLVKKHRLLIPSSFPPFLLPFPGLFGGPGGSSGNPQDSSAEEATGNVPSEAAAVAALAAGLLDSSGVGGGGTEGGGGDASFECNLCHRSFQTVYLLRMHKSYFHPDVVMDGEDESVGGRRRGLMMMMEEDNECGDNERSGGGGAASNSDNEESSQGGNSRETSPDPSPSGKSNKGSTKGTARGNSSNNKSDRLPTAEIEGRGEATSDSDDLRRLQTMIMELNRVSSAAVAWSPPLVMDPSGSHAQASSLKDPTSAAAIAAASSSSSGSTTLCQICNKEFYSTFFLQQHITHYHTGGYDSSAPGSSTAPGMIRIKSESPATCITPTGDSSSQHATRIKNETDAGKAKSMDIITQGTLKERLLHPEGFLGTFGTGTEGTGTFLTPGPKGSSGSNNNINNNNTIIKQEIGSSSSGGNGSSSSQAKRPSPSLSRSYCTICHKELCNKYFMRTHMLKMHGISIESSTGLGGVTCDICNKELCSKYFLKVHKQNTHGIVEDGPSPPAPSTPGPVSSSSSSNFPLLSTGPGSSQQASSGLNLSTNTPSPSSLQGQSANQILLGGGDVSSGGNGNTSNNGHILDPSLPLLPKEAQDLQTRYFYHYSESCPFCGRRFRSSKWLKTHLQSDHGDEGRERWKAIEKTLAVASSRRSSGQQHGTQQLHHHHHQQQQHQSHKSSSSSSKNNMGQGKGRNGGGVDGKGTISPLKSSSSSSSSALTRDGNRCGFCNFSSNDLDIMKNHLIKDHSAQLSSRQTQAVLNAEAAAMNAAALNAAALNAVAAAAAGYPAPPGPPPQGDGSLSHQGILLDPLTMLFQKMEGGSNKLYRCTYCPFTTSILVYLYAHERTHATGQLGSGTGSGGVSGGAGGDNFQCPMCFHSFDQPDVFQQHLIGHQMSGVLAPFFTPGQQQGQGAVSRLGFLSSPPAPGSGGLEHGSSQNLLSLPLLNGNTSGESLYWALKNNLPLKSTNGDDNVGGGGGGSNQHLKSETPEYGQNSVEDEEAADLSRKRNKKRRMEGQVEEAELEAKLPKRSLFRCSLCQARFNSREEVLSHMRMDHSSKSTIRVRCKDGGKGSDTATAHTNPLGLSRRILRKNLFRCRKCKFTSPTYQRLVVHCKLAHRPQSHNVSSTSLSRKYCRV